MFGKIYKVRHKTNGLIMCRKEIPYSEMGHKERQQLHAEFTILSSLRHPNIVAFYDREHLKESQDLHLYMEFCGGGDLGGLIKDLRLKNTRASESFVWKIFTQLTLALYRCHYGVDPPAAGTNLLGFKKDGSAKPVVPPGTMTILHRDLKPENGKPSPRRTILLTCVVFLDDEKNVKLGDFGLSKKLACHDFANTYVGTPFYMSPEICAGEKYTLKSDIWALGCVIYELCTREPPFNAKTQWDLIKRIKEGRVAPLPEIYSSELYSVLKECFRVNPDKRPDTISLLDIPAVQLLRKETEVLDMQKELAAKLEVAEARLATIDQERAVMRAEIESSVRLEWEVKARLEIDRQVAISVNAEVERLHGMFEKELQERVEAQLQQKAVSFAPEAKVEELIQPQVEEGVRTKSEQYVRPKVEQLARARSQTDVQASVDENVRTEKERPSAMTRAHTEIKVDYPQSSIGSTSGDEFPSTTDITEYESPEPVKEIKKISTRTPFGRAQTMFVGNAANTPMDICASPIPSIGALSLSPRRNAATKPPQLHQNNIFVVNSTDKVPSWNMPPGGSFEDSDDEFQPPSPTRQLKSVKNPFTSKTRPVLVSQHTAPARPKTSATGTGLVSKLGRLDIVETGKRNASEPGPRSTSPHRRLSKIPSAANLQENPTTTSSLPTKVGALDKKKSGEALGKIAAKNNIIGRSLVELQQARAGGRPASAAVGTTGVEYGNVSPKRAVIYPHRARSSSDDDVAVWDPATDEMPSPFLRRRKALNGY